MLAHRAFALGRVEALAELGEGLLRSLAVRPRHAARVPLRMQDVNLALDAGNLPRRERGARESLPDLGELGLDVHPPS